MKKLAKILGLFFAIFMAVIIIVPIIFKDDIKTVIDQAIAENINAQVYYNPDGFNLSLIPNFPDFTFGMEGFGIAGLGIFEKDTLLNVGSFEVVIDIMSVIIGDQISINAIILSKPNIKVKVLKNGQANYDIAIPSEEIETTIDSTQSINDEATTFSIKIKEWQIRDANLIYDDKSMNVYAKIEELNHFGAGDFTQDIFDLTTTTKIKRLFTSYEGVTYLNNKRLDMGITLNMDLPNSKYTFKENYVRLNNFGIGLDGYVAMPGENISMNLTFASNNVSFASILSLIPGVYQEYLDGVETTGKINFSGAVNGIYSEKTLPTIDVNLDIVDGMLRYEEYPVPIEAINVKTSLHMPGENMDAMTFDMPTFSMLMEGEEVTSNLHFENLKNYTWNFGFDGNLNLEKLLKIIPIENMNLKGKINAHLKTSGNMALIDAEKYDELLAKGGLKIRDFYFESEDLPQGFSITSSDLTFRPKSISLESFDAILGKSDMQMDGSLSNFIGYALGEDEVLKGNLNFTSNTFDLDEWMTNEEVTDTAPTEDFQDSDTSALEVIRLPTDIHFVMKSKIHNILYDSMIIEDLDGFITIKDGAVRLNNIDFNLLGGGFVISGLYNSAPHIPIYDFGFSIDHLSIPKSAETFNTVEKLAPVAKKMTGNFSVDFTINGSLDDGMMPNYDDMNGEGLIEILQASVQGEKIIKKIAELTKLGSDTLNISNTKITFQIKNGRMYVDPYEVDYWGQKATIEGSNGFDGSVDYDISTDVSVGAAGDAVNSFLSSYTGGKSAIGETIPISINVSGTYDNPKIGLTGSKASDGKSQSMKDAVVATAKAELEKQKKMAEEKIKAEIEKQKKSAEEELAKQKKRAEEEIARQKKIAEEKARAEIEKQKKIAEEKIKAEIEKQKKIAEEKAKKEAENVLKGFFK